MAQSGQPRSLRSLVSQQIAVYNQQHPRAQIDPRAALAVAAQEGLSGGIGDGGHAFGPFQENNAGGVLTGRFQGESPAQLEAWASSPQGIQDALGRIGTVAGGLTGAPAVKAIVGGFERPANPGREIQGALGAYGQLPAGTVPEQAPLASAAFGRDNMVGSPQPQPVPHDFRPELASQLAQAAGTQTNDLTGFYGTLRQALQARRQTAAAPHPAAGAPAPAHAAPAMPGGRVIGGQGEQTSFLAQLAQLAAFEHAPVDINSGYRSTAKQAQLYANRASNPNPVAPPGHSLHEQGLAADGTVNGIPLGTLPAALLGRFGLASVPGDPVHIQARR